MSNKRILILLFTSFIFTQYSFAQQTPLRSINLLPDEGDTIHSINISKDEKYILTGSRKPILWDAESGEKIRTFSGHDEFDSTTSFRIGVLSADISPDLSTIVSGDNRANIVISNFNNGQPIFKIKSTNLDPSGGGIVGVAVMPDNKRVLSANGNGTMEMWNIESGELIRLYTNRGSIKSMILRNEGNSALVELGNGVILLDLVTEEIINAYSGSSPKISQDGKILQIIHFDQVLDQLVILHWNLLTNEKIFEIPYPENSSGNTVDISPDAKNFLIGNNKQQNSSNSITNRMLFDAITPGSIRSYTARENVASNSPDSEDQIIKYFPFGRKFLTVNGNAVHIWDISDVVTRVKNAGIHEN